MKKYYIIGFIIIIVTIGLFEYRREDTKYYDKHCYGTLEYELFSDEEPYLYQVTHDLYISAFGVIYNTIKGSLIVNDHKYIINRTVNFSYRELANGKIEITPKHIYTTKQDTLSDEMTEKYFSYLLIDRAHLISIRFVDRNKILISGSHGPLFICAI
ncbi:TPA: hypothetical protein KEV01_003845 [Citrobacter koseri]|nr:hypothetical protein [Citrobacter koseri]